jgi:ParB family chromosome partitioning protein
VEGLQELVDSLAAQGVVQPLLVTPRAAGGHTVVAGHRRLAAARLAGLQSVPCLVRVLSGTEQLELMVVENVQRADLTPLQEARGYQALLEVGLTRADVARRVGVPANRVQSRLQVLTLAPDVQRLLDAFELPVTAVPVLAHIEDWDRQTRLARLVARRKLTVPQMERLVLQGATRLRKARQERASGRPPQLQPNAFGPEREQALRAVLARTTERLTFGRLAVAMEDVCTACGVFAQLPEQCRDCPLPLFVQALAPHAGRGPASGAGGD